MKITKYPQSCILIEDRSKRILIDPGSFVSSKYTASDLLPLDGILITHEHQDHVDSNLLVALTSGGNIPVIGNESTAKVYGELITRIVDDHQNFEVAGFKITARELPHCLMVDGSKGPQNTGYFIDGVFFHPGDGTEVDLKAKAAAVPIAGPDVSARDSYRFIRQLGCEVVIPIHYDYFLGSPEVFAQILAGIDRSIKVIPLSDGQSTTI